MRSFCSQAGPSRQWEEVEAPEECGVCLDAPVDVRINNCSHKLCCECAKAICCLEVSLHSTRTSRWLRGFGCCGHLIHQME